MRQHRTISKSMERPHSPKISSSPAAADTLSALLEDLGKNLALEHVKSIRISEKTRNADENVRIECVEFLGVAAKESCTFDLFFGTDYHSHLGTRRAGMAVYGENGFSKSRYA